MAVAQSSENGASDPELKGPLRVAVCGEVSAGKSTFIHAVLRDKFIPDFFGIEDRPVIRYIAGAEKNEIAVIHKDGTIKNMKSLARFKPTEGLAEIRIAKKDPSHFGPIELIEMPPLRDGFVSSEDKDRLEECDAMIWVTIGSQAWRLSEKTILDDLGDARPPLGMLVVSRGDKFRSEADCERLMERIHREASDYFPTRLMMHAAPKAIDNAKDDASWSETGAEDMVLALMGFSEALENGDGRPAKTVDNVISFDAAEVVEDDASDDVEIEDVEDEIAAELEAIEQAEAPAAQAEEPEVEAVEEVEEVEEVDPRSELEMFIDSLHGVIAIGAVDINDSAQLEAVYGSEDDARGYADFALSSQKSLESISTWIDQTPEGAHVTMKEHQVIFRNLDGTVLFLAAHSRMLSTGIARTAFGRFTRIYTEEKST